MPSIVNLRTAHERAYLLLLIYNIVQNRQHLIQKFLIAVFQDCLSRHIHQFLIEMQAVYGCQAHTQNFVHRNQMADVCPTEVSTGIASALRIDGAEILFIASC